MESSENNNENKNENNNEKVKLKSEKEITISEPLKHGDGSGAFVSYLISSSNDALKVRRRFQDFIQLHKWLQDSFPACIIPSLPGKAHSKYVIGDRFSEDFLERRMVALQSFLDRINRHPILSKSVNFAKFLSADQMALVDTSASSTGLNSNRDSTLFDNFTEGFINLLAKPKIPDERFTPFREGLEKLEQNVQNIEKLHYKAVKAEKELVQSFLDLGGAFENLGAMETQIQAPLTKIGESISHPLVELLQSRAKKHELDYVLPMHNYVTFMGAVKDLLRLRDDKQIDHEELLRMLQEVQGDRDKTRATGKSPGISGFFKDKMNDFKGVDPEKSRRDRLEKLSSKIDDLQDAVQASLETSTAFSTQVIDECTRFQAEKQVDFKEYLGTYAQTQLQFHLDALEFWNGVEPLCKEIKID